MCNAEPPTHLAPGASVRCVPDHQAGAVRFLEEHARITKLPAGSWRVWLRYAGLRVYGSTRAAALNEAAQRVKGRPVDGLLGDGTRPPRSASLPSDPHGPI